MIVWETKIVIIPSAEVYKDPESLNLQFLAYLGKEGWELVSAFRQSDGVGWVHYFKRKTEV